MKPIDREVARVIASILLPVAMGFIWNEPTWSSPKEGYTTFGDCSPIFKDVIVGSNFHYSPKCGLDEKTVREIVRQAIEAFARIENERYTQLSNRLERTENLLRIFFEVRQDIGRISREGGESQSQLKTALTHGDMRPIVKMYKAAMDDTTRSREVRAESSYRLGNLFYTELNFKDARTAYENAKSLEPTNGLYVYAMGTLLLWQLDQPREAAQQFEKARQLDSQKYGAISTDVARDLSALSQAQLAEGEYDKSIDTAKDALMIELKESGPFSTVVGDRYVTIGSALHAGRNYTSAIDFYSRAEDVYNDSLPKGDARFAYLWNARGDALLDKAWYEKSQKEYREAEAYYRKALNIYLQHKPSSNSSLAIVYENLGRTAARQGRQREAIENYEKALKINVDTFGEDHTRVATTRLNLGQAWYDFGDYTEAIRNDESALRAFKSVYGDNHPRTRYAETALTRAEAALEKRE